MTVRRGAVAAFAVLAGLAAVAAYALWQSRVPAGLEPVDVDAERFIDRGTVARAKRYETFFRIEFFVAQAALVGVLAFFASRCAGVARDSIGARMRAGTLLGVAGLVLAWLSQLPFELAAVWWRRRYDQTRSGYVETLLSDWPELVAGLVAGTVAIGAVMALASRFPSRWWLGAAPLSVVLAAGFAFAAPALSERAAIDRPALAGAAREYARVQGIAPVELVTADVTDFTSTPNAYALGFGPTSTIVLWNTLLDGRLARRELEVVVAHEVAHHSRGHIPKGLAWYALFALPASWLVALGTRRRGGMAQPAAVPVALLVVALLQLASVPVYNAISRHLEREADWVALETTRDPDAATGLFVTLATESLNDPDPPRWAYLLFDGHPTVEDRIAMAEAWGVHRR